MKRGIFLDRDGVINQPIIRHSKPHSPLSVRDLVIIPGVREAIIRLKEMGFEIVVVTNQPEVSRGGISIEIVNQINNEISQATLIEHFRVCPHDDSDNCYCRKPLPGLILGAAKELQIQLGHSYLVGDRWRDIEAGNRAGCKSFFVDHGYDEMRPRGDFFTAKSLADAVDKIRSFEND